jgi:hypothetical protein
MRGSIRPRRHKWTEDEVDLLTVRISGTYIVDTTVQTDSGLAFPVTMSAVTKTYFRLYAEERLYSKFHFLSKALHTLHRSS